MFLRVVLTTTTTITRVWWRSSLFTFNAQLFPQRRKSMNRSLNWNRMESFTIAKSTSSGRLKRRKKLKCIIIRFEREKWIQIIIMIHGWKRRMRWVAPAPAHLCSKTRWTNNRYIVFDFVLAIHFWWIPKKSLRLARDHLLNPKALHWF